MTAHISKGVSRNALPHQLSHGGTNMQCVGIQNTKSKAKEETECSMTADVNMQVHLVQVRKNIYLPDIISLTVSLNSWKSNSGPAWKQGPWQG